MKHLREVCLQIVLLCNVIVVRNEILHGERHENLTEDDHWIAKTSTGLVQGSVITVLDDVQVYVFYGIPYAEPPVGQLRFKPPKPVKPWTNIFSATKKPLPCYQQLNKASAFRTRYKEEPIKRPWTEDCLNLNIWVPKPKMYNLPVVFVFHPGVFEYGSNNYPDGHVLAAKSSVIVVSVNYRLGAFGFLNLGTPDVPGNMGLLDQQLALKWTNENVAAFGGLQRPVIVIGAGNAGAASAGYHLLSPGSAGLFSSASALSGSPLCSWAFQDREESIANSKLLIQRLDCNKRTIEESEDCLRRAHPEDIVDATTFKPHDTSHQILPTVDGTFISQSPVDTLRSGNFSKVYILSLNFQHEGSFMFRFLNEDLMPDPEKGLALPEFRQAVQRVAPNLSETGMSIIEDVYFDKCSANNPLRLRDAAIRLYSDVLVHCGVSQFLELYVKNGGWAYKNVNDYPKASNPPWVGSWHGNPDFYFGYTYIDDEYNTAEKSMGIFSSEWVYNNTRKKASEMGPFVVPFDYETQNYMLYSKTGPHVSSHFRQDECRLWNELLPRLSSTQKPCGSK